MKKVNVIVIKLSDANLQKISGFIHF